MDETRQASGGWLATGKRILRTIHGLAEARAELFLVELQEERIRLVDALLLVSACVVFSFMALALLTLTVVVIFWEHRVLVLGLLTSAYVAGAAWSFWKLRRRLDKWESFPATLEEFKKDQACLEKQD